MEKDRSTVNVLVLELATMIVAIALAFNADTLTTTQFRVDALLRFIIVTMVVIWFWWNYVMDRLEFPPRTGSFPFLDVLILVLISLFPIVLRAGRFDYTAGLLAVLMIVWAAMLVEIVRENPEVDETRRKGLIREAYERALVGLIFALSVVTYFISYVAGYALFVATVFIIIIRALLRRRAGGS